MFIAYVERETCPFPSHRMERAVDDSWQVLVLVLVLVLMLMLLPKNNKYYYYYYYYYKQY